MPPDGFHCSGSVLSRSRPARLRRLLTVHRLRKQRLTFKQIGEMLDLSPSVISSDVTMLNEFGVEAIQERLEALETPPAPVTPRQRRCVYMTVEDGQVRTCGALCKSQYCDAHREKVAPVSGPGLKGSTISGISAGR